MRAANQGGPFELLFYGLPYLIGVTGIAGWFVFYAIALAVVTFGVVLVVLVGAGNVTGRLRFYLALATAALANLGWFVPLAVLTGHPAQLVIPLLWVLAAIAAQQRQFIAVGALIGLATGWELWGMLGVPVILLAARPNLLKAALAGIVTLAVLYLPFVLSGEFHMFEFGWPIIDGTLVSVLLPTLEDFGWGLRLGQGVFVLLVGCGVALAARERFYAPWLVAVAPCNRGRTLRILQEACSIVLLNSIIRCLLYRNLRPLVTHIEICLVRWILSTTQRLFSARLPRTSRAPLRP